MNLRILGPNYPHLPILVQNIIGANMEGERRIAESAETQTTRTTEYQNTTEIRDMPQDESNERCEKRTVTRYAHGGSSKVEWRMEGYEV